MSAQSISEIVAGVIRREGGFVDHPDDRGGPTKYGITIKTLSRYLDRAATREDVRALSIDQAAEIYLRYYVAEPRFDRLPPQIAPFIVDTGVHSGPRMAARLLQRVINEAGFGPVDVDGVAGRATRQQSIVASQAMGPYFLAALIVARLNFLERLIAAKPSQKAFERGWKARLREFWPTSIAMPPELEAR